MRRAILVSPYFTPSNFAGVHRVRLMASRLADYGWEPIVVSVDPQYYEEANDPELVQLLPAHLRIEHTGALPEWICRPLGFGDISLRAYFALRRKIGELIRSESIDLIFVTILPGYAGLLGAWAKARFGIPFVLDYQDPWVSEWGASQSFFSKGGLAHRLARILEPRFATMADAVTAVSNGTLDGLRNRGLLRELIPTAELPIGSDPHDHDVARRAGQSHLTKEANAINLAYLGTVPEKKMSALRAIFRALATQRDDPKVILHLFGTSAQPGGTDSMGLGRLAEQVNATEFVRIEPRRIRYLDALRTMQEADALLMLGSVESHYTASKLFPYWLAERPIVGVAHAQSTVWEITRKIGGVGLFGYANEAGLDQAADKAMTLLKDLYTDKKVLPVRNPAAFEPYSPCGIARNYAHLFDSVMLSHDRP